MTKQVITTEAGGHQQYASSQAWRTGDLVFVAGTAPIGPDGSVAGGTIGEQTNVAIDNMEAVLRAAGASLADVVKVTVHLSETGLFPQFDQAYRERFSVPYPARITVGSDLSHVPLALVEMDCVAYMGD